MNRTTWLVATASILLLGGILLAQNITGTLTGMVRDQTGAAIIGATVTAANIATGISYKGSTNEAGLYVLPLLPLGPYQISVESPGFKRFVRSGIQLGGDQRLRIDVSLELGSLAEEVTVTGEAPAVKTDQATVGSSFVPSQIENLPIGRQVLNLMRVVPGVQSGKRDVSTGNINGSRAVTTDYEVDGLPATSANIGDVELQPITEMVEEMVVQTAMYTAESGRGATQVSLTTRPGTNDFRGALFYFFRNDALNANSYMNNALGSGKPKQRHNLFGATIGGPVVLPGVYSGRNKTFFNAGFEATRTRSFGQVVSSVPTPAMRAGDFVGRETVYDPSTTRANPAGSGFLRDPFPGNAIPSARFNSVAAKMLAVSYPLPTRSGPVNNFVREGSTPQNNDLINVRGDHNISDSSRLSIRYLNRKLDDTNLTPFEGPAGGFGGTSNTLFEKRQYHAGSLDHTYVLTPTLVNNFRFGVYRYEQNLAGPGTFEDWPSRVGLSNVPGDKFPRVTMTGLTPFGGSNIFVGFPGKNWNASDSVTWIKGRHSVKLGFEYRHYIFVDQRGSEATFAFDFKPTMNPQTSRQGESFASFLLGIPITSTLNLVALPQELVTHYLAGFVHDDFKVGRNLTLNAGLRWETTTPRKETHDYQSVFDLASRTLKLAGQGGYPRTLHDTDWLNFQPRFGFAWLPSDNQKTVIRGGYGIFILPADVTGNSFTLGPWRQAQSWQTPDNGITFPMTLSTAFPRFEVGPNAPFKVTQTTGVNWMPRDYPSPYMQQWTLNVQRALWRDTVVEAGYLGTRGVHLGMNYNLNQVPLALLGPGNAQSRRPYPEVNAITTVRNGPVGGSTYHALQIRVERRLADGFGMQAAYTLGKSIDNASGLAAWLDFGHTGVQDNYNLRAERSVSGFDITHNFSYNFLWQLPFGKGRKHLSAGGPIDYVLGGWNLSAMSTMRTGMPLIMSTQGNQTGSLGGGSRPIRMKDSPLPKDQRTLDRWFDSSGFERPAAYTFGNTSRTEPRLRSAGDVDLDFMLTKEFRFHENMRVQVRSEFFNAMNHFNPGSPNTSIGHLAVGRITGGNAGRTIQLSLRLYY